MSSKTWLITGTSTGLGRLMTERLLARGDKVIATLRKSGALDDLQAQYNGRLHILLLDVTDTDAVRRTVQQAFDFAGRIDVLVSNAGYGLFGAAEEVSDAQIDRQIATNLIGPIQLIRAALPLCVGREADVLCRYRQKAGRLPGRISAFITLPNGGLKDLLNPSPRKWRLLASIL